MKVVALSPVYDAQQGPIMMQDRISICTALCLPQCVRSSNRCGSAVFVPFGTYVALFAVPQADYVSAASRDGAMKRGCKRHNSSERGRGASAHGVDHKPATRATEVLYLFPHNLVSIVSPSHRTLRDTVRWSRLKISSARKAVQ